MTVLVTGAAGFIGMHTSEALLDRGVRVVGIDNLNDYYDVSLKRARLARLERRDGFEFNRLDISDRDGVQTLMDANPDIDRIIHLAAQAGVRYSLENPFAYLSRAISRGTSFCWKRAGRCRASSISSTPRRRRSMAPTPRCRFPSMIVPTTRYRSTAPPRSPWR